jgi:hypothetical protein
VFQGEYFWGCPRTQFKLVLVGRGVSMLYSVKQMKLFVFELCRSLDPVLPRTMPLVHCRTHKG